VAAGHRTRGLPRGAVPGRVLRHRAPQVLARTDLTHTGYLHRRSLIVIQTLFRSTMCAPQLHEWTPYIDQKSLLGTCSTPSRAH